MKKYQIIFHFEGGEEKHKHVVRADSHTAAEDQIKRAYPGRVLRFIDWEVL